MAKQNTQAKQNAQATNNVSEPLFNIYGARISQSDKYVNLSLVKTDDKGNKTWLNVPVKIKGGKTGVRVYDDCVVLAIARLDVKVPDAEVTDGIAF